MKDTRCGDKCAFIKAGFCKSDEDCPNYVESFWENKEGEVSCIKDCSPKRQMLETQRICTRFLGIQSSVEQMRNRIDNLETILQSLVNESRFVLENFEKKQIENKD